MLLALPWRPIAPIIIIIATSVHTWRHGNTARSYRLFDTSTARVERQMSNCKPTTTYTTRLSHG